jgi:hypothetical protein
MDINAFFFHQQLGNTEDEDIEAQQQLVGLATAIILLRAIDGCGLSAERWKPSRLYLCRPQLLGKKTRWAVASTGSVTFTKPPTNRPSFFKERMLVYEKTSHRARGSVMWALVDWHRR